MIRFASNERASTMSRVYAMNLHGTHEVVSCVVIGDCEAFRGYAFEAGVVRLRVIAVGA
jgi:hypothetical protein